jgi:superfamily II DNA/RNA helicase
VLIELLSAKVCERHPTNFNFNFKLQLGGKQDTNELELLSVSAQHKTAKRGAAQQGAQQGAEQGAEQATGRHKDGSTSLTIVFIGSRKATEEVAAMYESLGYSCAALHGDLPQARRTQVVQLFKQVTTHNTSTPPAR